MVDLSGVNFGEKGGAVFHLMEEIDWSNLPEVPFIEEAAPWGLYKGQMLKIVPESLVECTLIDMRTYMIREDGM